LLTGYPGDHGVGIVPESAKKERQQANNGKLTKQVGRSKPSSSKRGKAAEPAGKVPRKKGGRGRKADTELVDLQEDAAAGFGLDKLNYYRALDSQEIAAGGQPVLSALEGDVVDLGISGGSAMGTLGMTRRMDVAEGDIQLDSCQGAVPLKPGAEPDLPAAGVATLEAPPQGFEVSSSNAYMLLYRQKGWTGEDHVLKEVQNVHKSGTEPSGAPAVPSVNGGEACMDSFPWAQGECLLSNELRAKVASIRAAWEREKQDFKAKKEEALHRVAQRRQVGCVSSCFCLPLFIRGVNIR
jgi:hypothetical protein